jgi:replicative DNA helicase
MKDELRNPELEKAALGALLIDEQALAEVANILEPEDFFDQRHVAIYRATLEVSRRGAIPDYLTIS